MQAELSAHAIVYQVLDDVLASGCVPARARGAMFSAVDQLRSAPAGRDEVHRAERISVEMHKLEWALRQGDHSAIEASHERLKALAADWINTRICNRH